MPKSRSLNAAGAATALAQHQQQQQQQQQQHQAFAERMAIIESVLTELQQQAKLKPTVESAVQFQFVGARKVLKRMVEEVSAARELRDHYKKQRDEAREELRLLKDSLTRLSSGISLPASAPAVPAPVPPVAPAAVSTSYSSWSGEEMSKAVKASGGADVVDPQRPLRSAPSLSSLALSPPKPAKSASAAPLFLPLPVVVPTAADDDDSATVFQDLSFDDSRTIYGAFD
jgi:hypothetical protein